MSDILGKYPEHLALSAELSAAPRRADVDCAKQVPHLVHVAASCRRDLVPARLLQALRQARVLPLVRRGREYLAANPTALRQEDPR